MNTWYEHMKPVSHYYTQVLMDNYCNQGKDDYSDMITTGGG